MPTTTTTIATTTTLDQLSRDVETVVGFYEEWNQAVRSGRQAIEAFLNAHLYPGLAKCASGEKTLSEFTAYRHTVRPSPSWRITWGPLDGAIPMGRLYEIQLAEGTSPSHVTILDEVPYVFWNCQG